MLTMLARIPTARPESCDSAGGVQPVLTHPGAAAHTDYATPGQSWILV